MASVNNTTSGSETLSYMDVTTLDNLRSARYKISVTPLSMRATCLVSHGQHVFVGLVNIGLHIFRYSAENIWPVHKIGAGEELSNGRMSSRVRSAIKHCEGCTTITDLSVTEDHLAYFKEESAKTYLCVHKTNDVINGKLKPIRMLETKRRAPMIVDGESGHVIIGGVAWTSSWTCGGATDFDPYPEGEKEEHNVRVLDLSPCDVVREIEEHSVRVLDLSTCDVVRQFRATDNAIFMLRAQTTNEHNMLAVADARSGVRVYDLRQPTEEAYTCLYQVPVDEIRNFHLAGNFIGVFHKFESNVSFWNVVEQKTILCINIQDQMRELCAEFCDNTDDFEDEEDMGMYDEFEEDNVAAVCSVNTDDDAILIYGTKSGCVFGMSVNTRRKLFNIPCPFGSLEGPAIRAQVQGISFLPGGRLAVAYDRQGLTVLDFGMQNPPNRPPPTRHMRRPTTT